MRVGSSLNHAMRVSQSGLVAERFRMDVISNNIANSNSVKVDGKDPYRRQDVVLEATENGVKVRKLVKDQTPFRDVDDPNNPGQKTKGSNVDTLVEMVNMVGASRAYEANIAAFNSAKGMIRAALRIGQ